MRVCKCGESNQAQFTKRKKAKYGLESQCKACVKKYKQTDSYKEKARERDRKRYHSKERQEWVENYKPKRNEDNRERSKTPERKAYVAKWREANREKLREDSLAQYYKYKDKETIRDKVRQAVKSGLIVKPTVCTLCGVDLRPSQIQGHHWDYGQPLDVVWCCGQCHADIHRTL